MSLIPNEREKNQSHGDFLIYYVFNCEFLFLFIKIVAKFYKLIINIFVYNVNKTKKEFKLLFITILVLFLHILHILLYLLYED